MDREAQAESSADVQFSIADLPAAPVALADLAQEWAVGQDSRPAPGVPCIPPVPRPADQVVRASVQDLARDRVLVRGQDLGSVQAQVAQDSPHRLRVRLRAPRVRVREAAAARVTRRPKKAR